eukprot:scaffold5851_cov115-Skeletonema_marinoi.AAC.4
MLLITHWRSLGVSFFVGVVGQVGVCRSLLVGGVKPDCLSQRYSRVIVLTFKRARNKWTGDYD